MNGAVFETIFNVFFKLNYAKTYEGVLATPMGITEIALGEMLWALFRAALYAVAMFVIMLVFGLILSPWGSPDRPGGAARRRRVRRRRPGRDLIPAHGERLRRADGPDRDADVPLQRHVLPDRGIYPVPVQVFLVQLTPLYHAINLIRGLSTGLISLAQAWDFVYLLASSRSP